MEFQKPLPGTQRSRCGANLQRVAFHAAHGRRRSSVRHPARAHVVRAHHEHNGQLTPLVQTAVSGPGAAIAGPGVWKPRSLLGSPDYPADLPSRRTSLSSSQVGASLLARQDQSLKYQFYSGPWLRHLANDEPTKALKAAEEGLALGALLPLRSSVPTHDPGDLEGPSEGFWRRWEGLDGHLEES